ncbi:hypothetical protein Shyd_18790 [Streptomyces hydrogenans]|uniref:Uncharacterized protein n=1 Tax=Streptomyces hydrogenans TaxID=1873719 RepID=A0ABQ3P657_9ACTN|nr:hypothetical protein Shyd_18790 [Streptomyces hydrogenans]
MLMGEARQRFLTAHVPSGTPGEQDTVRDVIAYAELEVLKEVVPQIRQSALRALAGLPAGHGRGGTASTPPSGRVAGTGLTPARQT